MFSPSGFFETLLALFTFWGFTKLVSPSLSFAVSLLKRFDVDLRNECRRVLMRVDLVDMFDRAEPAVLVEMLLRTDWKEKVLRDDVLFG